MGEFVKYLENPGRAAFLNGNIDGAIFSRIAIDIVKLRHSPDVPICLYIDSLGGNVQLSERIIDLIKAPCQSGQVPWLITVAYGYAASAAANLLTLGDYAIVYPTAVIHHHGTRQIGPEVRLEDISTLADGLRETNERLASRLASRIFKRMVFLAIASSFTDDGEEDEPEQPTLSLAASVASPQSFFARLRKKVSPQSQQLLNRVMARQKRIDDLVKQVESLGLRQAAPSVDQDAVILKAIVDFEAELIKQANQNQSKNVDVITYEQADRIKSDYRELYEYFFGTFRTQLNDIVLTQGISFLSPEEAVEHQSLTSADEKIEFLKSKVEPLLEPLWNLVVSLCRCLQEGENTLTPLDAYWLGLVDEVVGTNLPCYRRMFQPPPPPPIKRRSPKAPARPTPRPK